MSGDLQPDRKSYLKGFVRAGQTCEQSRWNGSEQIESQDMPEGGDAISPGDLLALGVIASGVGDRDLIDPPASLRHLGGDLRFEAEAVRLQFDASDDLLFEYCEGTVEGKKVRIAWDDLELPDDARQIENDFIRKAYETCFANIPRTAGLYLNPLSELE